jgi:hypothetical protein
MIIDGTLFVIFLWAILYFVAKEMYNDILPEKITEKNRKFLIEISGILCFVTIPLGFIYICFEFIKITLKIIWDNIKLFYEIGMELRKLKRGEK